MILETMWSKLLAICVSNFNHLPVESVVRKIKNERQCNRNTFRLLKLFRLLKHIIEHISYKFRLPCITQHVVCIYVLCVYLFSASCLYLVNYALRFSSNSGVCYLSKVKIYRQFPPHPMHLNFKWTKLTMWEKVSWLVESTYFFNDFCELIEHNILQPALDFDFLFDF